MGRCGVLRGVAGTRAVTAALLLAALAVAQDPFESLFDGTTLAGWKPAPGWSAAEGEIRFDGKGADSLVSKRAFGDCELRLEWLIQSKGDSGIYLRGCPQVQIWDNPEGSGALWNNQRGPAKPLSVADRPVGEWNEFRIRMVGDAATVHLNGVLVTDSVVLENYWDRASPVPERGPIWLQAHESPVRFRNIRVRELPVGHRSDLFNGVDLAGWTPMGDAIWTVEEGTLLGRVGGGSQSFLATERSFGDFRLDLEVKAEDQGNSGIQFRSSEKQGRLAGYQAEVDPSARQYSGGLYDEFTGRGWLQDLSDNPQGRAAWKDGDWNRYRIEADGPRLRCWVNGVPTADVLDTHHTDGVIGLQVHSGRNTRVRWRGLTLLDRGVRHWQPLFTPDLDGWKATKSGNWRLDGEGVLSSVGAGFLTRSDAGEFCMTMEVRGGLTLRLPDGSERLDPDRDDGSWRTLEIIHAGGRVVVIGDGESVCEPPIPAIGPTPLVLSCVSGAVQIRNARLLGPASDR